MSAPKGNEYWKKRFKSGRKRKFDEPKQLWEEFIQYAEWVQSTPWMKSEVLKGGDLAGKIIEVPVSRPLTIEGLCLFLDIDFQTFENYGEKEGYEDFFEVVTRIRKAIRDFKLEGAIVGAFNSNIISRDLGLMDKQDITSDGKVIKNVISFGGKEVEL